MAAEAVVAVESVMAAEAREKLLATGEAIIRVLADTNCVPRLTLHSFYHGRRGIQNRDV
jgi:hypothetical protein